MDGYKVTRVVGLVPAGEDFVLVIEDQRGNSKGIALTQPLLEEVAGLLGQVIHPSRGASIDPGTPEKLSVARIEIRSPVDPRSPWSPGIFEIRLGDQNGKGVTLRLPHDEVVTWRDRLTEMIDDWVSKRAN